MKNKSVSNKDFEGKVELFDAQTQKFIKGNIINDLVTFIISKIYKLDKNKKNKSVDYDINVC